MLDVCKALTIFLSYYKVILADFAQFLGGSTEGHDFGAIYSAADVILSTFVLTIKVHY